MKITAILLLSSMVFLSCGGEKEQAEASAEETVVGIDALEEKEYLPYHWDTLQGIYSGPFSDKEININLTYVSEFNAVGYSVMNGLIRNISGKVTQNEDSVKLILEEPGDHPHDGTFYLNIHKKDFGVKGKWEAFHSSVPSKSFKLKKKIIDFELDIDYDNPKITNESSFVLLFGECRDSLGTYQFSMDGSVVYEFYNTPDEFEAGNEAMQKAMGSWMLKNGLITVYWQPNFAFPNLKSQFRMVKGEFKLQGEGRTIYSMFGAG